MDGMTQGPAALRKLDNGWEGVLSRSLDHSPAEVWRLLTEPATLPQWLAAGTIELRQGGAVRIDFVDSGILIESTVLAIEPGQLLSYSWSKPGEPERPLRWEVAPEGTGARLTLSVHIPVGEDIAKACAGFHAHLEMLAAALEGVPIRFPFEDYVAARKALQARLDGEGAAR